jgi:hypothetical protein
LQYIIFISVKIRVVLLSVIGLISGRAEGQQVASHYYVVVGGFAMLDNAVRYTSHVNDDGFNAQYAFIESRKLYYVFLFESEDRKKAFVFLNKIKQDSAYKNAWIFKGNLGVSSEAEAAITPPADQIKS